MENNKEAGRKALIAIAEYLEVDYRHLESALLGLAHGVREKR